MLRFILPSLSVCAVLGAVFSGDVVQGAERVKMHSADMAQLVEQLGNEDFAKREKATQQLIEVGLPAIDALKLGERNSDREIRYRSMRILSVIREYDFQRRLSAFAADVRGDRDYQLPAWKRFREAFGDSPEVRALFVEMQKSESELMQAVEAGSKEASATLTLRTQQLQTSKRLYKQELTLGNVAALLFVAGDANIDVGVQASSMLYTFCHESSFRVAITAGPRSKLLRTMLGTWITRGEDWTAYQGLTLAMQYDLKAGIVPAQRVLKAPNMQSYVKQYGILTLAKLGDKSHVPLLETMLDDPTPCSSQRLRNVQYQTQIRDVALASILHLMKLELKDFGFDAERVQPNPQIVFNTSTLGFQNDEKRKVAREKWDAYRAAHPVQPPSKEANAAGDAGKPESASQAKPQAGKPGKDG